MRLQKPFRGQGSFEYILLIGGLVLVTALGYVFLSGAATSSANQTNQTYKSFTEALKSNYTPLPLPGGGGSSSGCGTDTVPPTVGLIAPSSASVGTSVSFTASANDSCGVATCDFYWGGAKQDPAMSVSGSANNVTATFTKLLTADGTFEAYAKCADSPGNSGQGAAANVQVSDIDAPQYASFGPASLTLEQGSAVDLRAKWTDNVGVAGIIFSSNFSGAWSNDSGEYSLGAGGWSNFTRNVPSSSPLAVGWRIYARDAASPNNWDATPIGVISVVQETVPPAYFASTIGTNVSNPATGEPVKHYANWSDNRWLSGYVFSSNYSGTWTNDSLATFGPSNWSNVSKTMPSSVGAFGWRIWASDAAGNWNVLPNQTITTFDRASPQFSGVSQNTSTPSIGAYIRLSFTVSDNIALSAYNFSSNLSGAWQNDTWQPLSSNPQTVTLDKLVTGAGAYGWKIYANDTSGNLNVSGQLNFTVVDLTAPQFEGVGEDDSAPAGGQVLHYYALWSDNVALSSFKFNSNYSGTWGNDTPVSLSGSSAWSNYSTSAPSTMGVYGWQIWASDASGNWNVTPVRAIISADSVPPQFSTLYANGSSFYVGNAVRYTGTVTDNLQISGYLFSNNFSGTWSNDSLVPTSGTTRTASGTAAISSTDTTQGWRMWATDTSGNWNASAIQTIGVYDGIPPRYWQFGVNNSAPNAGDTVKHYSNWTDNDRVSQYIFSSNYSGAWSNESGWLACGGAAVAWCNYSKVVPTFGTFGWRIYVRDWYGNANVTPISVVAAADLVAPTPVSISSNNSNPGLGSTVELRSSWTDNANPRISGFIFSNNFSGTWANSSWNLSSDGTWSRAVATVNSYGRHYWKFYANDTANNWGITPPGYYIYVADAVLPTYSNVMMSNPNPPGGASVKHSVLWSDNYALNYARFFANYSGVWSSYNPNMGLSGNLSWGNYTFNVPSTPGTYGWYMRAYDNFSNTVTTPTQAFVIP
ncbi:MAG: hypothetical protein WC792_02850 [Candidatus Micrarchaeia archaeon]